MKNEILLKLIPKKENTDFSQIVVNIANDKDINLKDYEVCQINSVIDSYKDEILKYLIKYGYTSFIKRGLILEALVTKGTSQNKIVDIFKRYLDSIGIDDELIIIDPYFYASTKNSNYSNLVKDILDKYLSKIINITVITLPNKIDNPLKKDIEVKLKSINPSLNLMNRTSNDWHDRFIISNSRKKGIITGTSLNGFGNKYALIDKLTDADVNDIVQELQNNKLIFKRAKH